MLRSQERDDSKPRRSGQPRCRHHAVSAATQYRDSAEALQWGCCNVFVFFMCLRLRISLPLSSPLRPEWDCLIPITDPAETCHFSSWTIDARTIFSYIKKQIANTLVILSEVLNLPQVDVHCNHPQSSYCPPSICAAQYFPHLTLRYHAAHTPSSRLPT